MRAPLTALVASFTNSTGTEVRYTFGASGLLKERIEKNERADIIASANTENPQSLADRGLAGSVRISTRNEMCALVSSKILNAAPLKGEEEFCRLVIPDSVHTSRLIRQVESILVRQVE